MQLPSKEHQGLPGATRSWERPGIPLRFSSEPTERTNLLTHGFWTSSFQNRERINFAVLSHPFCSTLLWQPQATNPTSNRWCWAWYHLLPISAKKHMQEPFTKWYQWSIDFHLKMKFCQWFPSYPTPPPATTPNESQCRPSSFLDWMATSRLPSFSFLVYPPFYHFSPNKLI